MRSHGVLFAGIIALASWTTAMYAAAAQHEAGAHQHTAAAAMKNPTKATPESLAAGKKLYDAQCAMCHGATGKGDGKMAAAITTGPKPSSMTDAEWKHGSTDGEIFTVIREGVKGTGMRGFAARMKPADLWNLVNYVRSLGSAAPKAN